VLSLGHSYEELLLALSTTVVWAEIQKTIPSGQRRELPDFVFLFYGDRSRLIALGFTAEQTSTSPQRPKKPRNSFPISSPTTSASHPKRPVSPNPVSPS
jgi:hypothetical protein